MAAIVAGGAPRDSAIRSTEPGADVHGVWLANAFLLSSSARSGCADCRVLHAELPAPRGPCGLRWWVSLEGMDAGVMLCCGRCRSRWREVDPVALAGLSSGYGVQCPGCRSVVVPERAIVPRLRL